jgi:hypothetical protein
MDQKIAEALSDLRLIRQWRTYALNLESRVKFEQPTTGVARDLGYVEREMERRGIRHDDPRGEVRDSKGDWHKP